MKINIKKLHKLCAALTIVLAMLIGGFSHYSAQAADADTLAAQIADIDGLYAYALNATTVNVYGSSTSFPNTTLNIDHGVTVVWNADITGRAAASSYVLTLTGQGTFRLAGSGRLSNNPGSAGGTVYIYSGVTLEVGGNSIIESPGSGSAVTVVADAQDVTINVSGGTIRSVPSGYAINDGAGMTNRTNNTQINVSAGLVEAGSACAIRSTGRNSVVTVSGGIVTNAAASNPNATIYMNYAPPPDQELENIRVSGGIVRTTSASATSYVLQTTQNLRISGGEVQSIMGRAVNLVGLNSVGTIEGTGRVSTVNGIALSTATTILEDVNYAGFIISGGIVEATGTGTAIKITGYESTVAISNGQVLARSGNAIDASGRPANNSVRVSGGFVFAWGSDVTGAANVIYPEAKLDTANVGGVIVAWNEAVGTRTYTQRTNDDLTVLPNTAAPYVFWDVNPDRSIFHDGIHVSGAELTDPDDFFGLSVDVIQQFFTLIIETRLDGVLQETYTQRHEVRAGTTREIEARGDNAVEYFPSLAPYDRPATNGDKFLEWSGNGIFLNPTSSVTMFTMPSDDVTITANFGARRRLQVTPGTIVSPLNYGPNVYNFSPSEGYYAPGEIISIQTGYQIGYSPFLIFNYWGFYEYGPGSSDYTNPNAFGNANSLSTTFTMPGTLSGDDIVHIEPKRTVYNENPPQLIQTTTTSVGGIITETSTHEPVGGETFDGYAGTILLISAYEPPPGRIFSHWETNGGGFFDDRFSSSTRYTTPNQNVTITAITIPIYTLAIQYNNHSANPTPPNPETNIREGDSRIIVAPDPAPNQRFAGWTLEGSGDASAHISNPAALSTVFTMPALTNDGDSITIVANYITMQFPVITHNGSVTSPDSQVRYDAGSPVTVRADQAATGMRFDRWVVASGNVPAHLLTRPEFTFTMPPESVELIATYVERRPPATTDPPDSAIATTAVAAAHTIPQTGDNNRTGIYIALLIATAGAIGTAIYFKIAKKR